MEIIYVSPLLHGYPTIIAEAVDRILTAKTGIDPTNARITHIVNNNTT